MKELIEFIEELEHNQRINFIKNIKNRVDIDYVIERLKDIKKEGNNMVKYELTESDRMWLEHAEEITDTDYEIGIDNYVPIENLINAIVDLVTEYSKLDEKFSNYKEFVKDNFKQKTLEESYR